MDPRNPIIIIGAGGAGLLAGWKAASRGARVLVLERNTKPGIKLLISGGGKCNVTHAGPMEAVRTAFRPREARFLKHSFYRFTNDDIIHLLGGRGVATYARENGRVFPVSGRADDVVDTLVHYLRSEGAELRLNAHVSELLADAAGVQGVLVNGSRIPSRHVIIATGGSSYPKTGTTGDGYVWARALGHTVLPLQPALAPIGIVPPLPASWRGVAIRGCRLAVYAQGRKVAYFDGDILFSHEGISGPAALEVSNAAASHEGSELILDFFPSQDFPQLDAAFRERVEAQRGKMIETLLHEWLPNRIVADLLQGTGVDPATRGHILTADQRRAVVRLLKEWRIGRVGRVQIERGEVTAGGVSLDEVDPRTMRSRKVPGLYLAGEVLDIAGPVGGYNLQAAFSTGVVAGDSAADDWLAVAA